MELASLARALIRGGRGPLTFYFVDGCPTLIVTRQREKIWHTPTVVEAFDGTHNLAFRAVALGGVPVVCFGGAA